MVRRTSLVISILSLFIGSLLAFGPTVLAESHHHKGPRHEGESAMLRGTVTAFSLSSPSATVTGNVYGEAGGDIGSITVNEAGGQSVTAAIVSGTRIMTTAQALAAGFVGQFAFVQVHGLYTGTPVATMIQVGMTRGEDQQGENGDHQGQNGDHQGQNGKVEGVVASAPTGSPATFTVQEEDGTTLTVDLSANTVVRVGDYVGSVQDIVQGAKVEVYGSLQTDGSLLADLVKVSNDRAEGSGKLKGVVTTAPSGVPGSFTLQEEDGTTVTVDLTATTVIRLGDQLGTVADISQGAQVKVFGIANPDGTFTAVLVKVSNDQGGQGDQGAGNGNGQGGDH